MGLGISCSQNSYLSRLRGTIARKPLWSRLGCAAIPLRISTTYPTGQSSTPKACTLSAGSGFILRQVLTSVYSLVSRVTPVHTALRNCTRDEGRSFEVGNQVLISSHRKLLSSKAMVVNVAEKSGHDPVRQG